MSDAVSTSVGDAPVVSPLEPAVIEPAVVESAVAESSVVESTDGPSPVTFRQLPLSEPILQAVAAAGYETPTPIQLETIPLLLAGRDVLGQAQTGTGKTAAFALPMLSRLDLRNAQPQVLVLTPTRELAIQVAEAFEKYAASLPGFRVVAIYGGQDYQVQFRQLDRGVHVVVGTPGRVMDHMRRGSLKLDSLRGLVLDEADEMLRMGFAEDVEWVLTQAPAQRQIALFSATLPPPIRRIAEQHLRDPASITIRQRTATADTVRQRFVLAQPQHKDAVLSRVLEAETIDGVLVFVKLKSTTEPLADYLNQCGHRAAALNGDMAQKQRERIVEQLRTGQLDVVVATDVAARGLDVQRVSHVVNFDLPFDSEAYVHRIGRTGRAGRSGEAILFVQPRERGRLRRLEQATRQKIEPMEVPSNRAINKQRIQRFHARVTASLERPELSTFESVIEQYRLQFPDVPVEKIAAAVALMAHGEAPLFIKDELPKCEFSEPRRARADGDFSRSHDREHDRSSPKRPRSPRPDEPMETFRIEVGKVHHVKPANIVGAIANETGLESSFIGRINIFDEFSTVDLPEGMPPAMFATLKKVWVSGRRLEISRVERKPYRKFEKRSPRHSQPVT